MAVNLRYFLYTFKLTQLSSFESKNYFELSTQNEVSWAYLNTSVQKNF